eukprot:305586_1
MLSKNPTLMDSTSTPRGIRDDATLLIETCELIAPMTRIRGKFKLTSTSITFIPDQHQPDKNKSTQHEINLAMNPPPLYASKSTSPTSLMYKRIETKTLNTPQFQYENNSTSSMSQMTLNEEKKSTSQLTDDSRSNKSQLEAMVINTSES